MSHSSGHPTRLYLRDLRVDELLDAVRLHRPRTVDELRRLPVLGHMAGEVLAVAIADATCMGRLAEGPRGELLLLEALP